MVGAREDRDVRWMYPEVIEEQVLALAKSLSVHPLVARVLVARGYTTPEAANAFLADKLSELPDGCCSGG